MMAAQSGWASESAAHPTMQAPVKRPNILLLLTDDQRWDTLGCLGNPVIRTPNVDRLAHEGVLFINAFVTTSVCGPSRTSILTGTYARSRGVGDLDRIMTPVDPAQTLPAMLRHSGYQTGHIGKWDVGTGEAGYQLGVSLFDYWAGDRFHGNYWHDAQCPLVTANGWVVKTNASCTCPPHGSLPRTGCAGIKQPLHFDRDLVPLKVGEFLGGRDRAKPFYLSVSFRGPKDPWSDYPTNVAQLYEADAMPIPQTANLADAGRQPHFLQQSMGSDHGRRLAGDHAELATEMRHYYRQISTIDNAVGQLRQVLADANVAGDTIILFTSDNGHFLGDHGFWGKWLPYEPSIRVPLVVYDPGLSAKQRGRVCDEMVLNIDLAPTILTLVNLSVPPFMQGMSMTPLLDGKKCNWRTNWFYEHTWTAEGRITTSEAVRSQTWKLIRYPGETPAREQLFHLKSDPNETDNRIADPDSAAVANQMRKQLEAYTRNLSR